MSDDLKTLVAQEVAKQLAAIAADQTTKKVLNFLNQKIGIEDKAEIVGWCLPNYAAGNTQTVSRFEAPMDGLVIVNLGWYQGYKEAKVNGYTFCVSNNNSGAGQQSAGCVPVSTDDVIEIRPGTAEITFFPMKGI